MMASRKFLLISFLAVHLVFSAACGMTEDPTYLAPTQVRFTPTSEALVDPAPEPLQFDSAPPNSELVSNWRPPLYPVPLALTPFDHFYFAKPFSANESPWPVEDYRYGGTFFEDIVHTGMDIKIPVGSPIIAAGPGKVVWAGFGLFSGRYDPDDPYGNAVMIRHDFGYKGQRLYTVYAHLLFGSSPGVFRGMWHD
jgi:murein DD-endopeptidase MepM/ murein hydrolase activator NlpD